MYKVLIKIMIFSLFIIQIFFTLIFIRLEWVYKLDYVYFDERVINPLINIDINYNFNYSKEQLKSEILEQFYFPANIIILNDCDFNGKWLWYNSNIYIKNNLNNLNYVYTLTHELIHRKYFSSNERFVTFNTIIWLYSNKNIELNNYGKKIIYMSINSYILNYESDCKYYLYKYLEAQTPALHRDSR